MDTVLSPICMPKSISETLVFCERLGLLYRVWLRSSDYQCKAVPFARTAEVCVDWDAFG